MVGGPSGTGGGDAGAPLGAEATGAAPAEPPPMAPPEAPPAEPPAGGAAAAAWLTGACAGAGALAGAGEDSGAGAWLAIGCIGLALAAFAVLVALELFGVAAGGVEPDAALPDAPDVVGDAEFDIDAPELFPALLVTPDAGEPPTVDAPAELDPAVGGIDAVDAPEVDV